ncbi:bifunctional serine/threonine-protein kinase/ABC transporter substrate-binding protein [Streptomyces sp. N2-109]|uniref:Bifunctional serine/threonine-protein kinase/ABC transporter substrate-binding protein n=1 Tax=Streptomyces gossypii TaxID=2883101 RepID=A0ABT2K2A6_9ACTN|nr:bifunctional serine/threonine-protein kinase/ABC transporter substrate-binding protein [Streptomyces gossypii]MCT2593665.1 bifunctional serine/threonine-protein kinase/ABC transporter substrate-binding protein [Streptomyces gossypii]
MREALRPSDASRVGTYRLLGRLGAGGMGVVYLGRGEDGELAAVKVIQPEHADEADFRARFRREVAAARRVVSPWTVPVLAADVQARAPWLATAFVAGPSLSEALGACGPLPMREVRVLGKVLARALAAVHDAGLVHRDVKPGNVLLALDGPRLIDFGIARSQSSHETTLTSADVVVGTPGFLSPEQARAERVTGAGDVFSLACVLAYAASGRLPFGTGEAGAVLYRTVHDEPDLSGIGTGADGGAALRELLLRCLAKDPDDRPSAAELDEALVEDVPQDSADWLPEPVVRLIAARSAEALALPDIDETQADAAAPPPALPARRGVLAWAGGGALLLAGGGGAGLWALLRDDGSGSTPAKKKAAREWVIGIQADLSGPRKAVGVAQERGARLAVEHFNAGEDKPFTAALKASDDRGGKERAVTVARAFTGDDDILAVLGPTGDHEADAAIPAYDEAALPLLSISTALSVSAGRREARSHFTAVPENALACTADAVLLRSLGSRRVGMVWDRAGTLAAAEMGVVVRGELNRNGMGTYPRVVPRDAGEKDLVRVIADMTDQEIDAFYYVGTPERGAAVARALAARDFDGPRLIAHPSVSEVFLREAGKAGEGWETFAPYIGPSAEQVRDFATAYRKRYGKKPDHWAAEGFDVARLVLRRLAELAGDGARPDRPTREELVDALTKSTYKGLIRTYAFNSDDRTLKDSTFFRYRVAKGRLRYLGPTPSPA